MWIKSEYRNLTDGDSDDYYNLDAVAHVRFWRAGVAGSDEPPFIAADLQGPDGSTLTQLFRDDAMRLWGLLEALWERAKSGTQMIDTEDLQKLRPAQE